ncbi:MAG: hypothetical protein AB1611_09095 [bacterium]
MENSHGSSSHLSQGLPANHLPKGEIWRKDAIIKLHAYERQSLLWQLLLDSRCYSGSLFRGNERIEPNSEMVNYALDK